MAHSSQDVKLHTRESGFLPTIVPMVDFSPHDVVQVAEELVSTSARADTMNGVVAALPTEGDTTRIRAYNWQDVQDLQEVKKAFFMTKGGVSYYVGKGGADALPLKTFAL